VLSGTSFTGAVKAIFVVTSPGDSLEPIACSHLHSARDYFFPENRWRPQKTVMELPVARMTA
jgi:hypothetical protein